MYSTTRAVLATAIAFATSPTLLAADSYATPAVDPRFEGGTLVGTWSLDTFRLPMPPEQRPKSVRFAFADEGGNTWRTNVDIVYAPGQEVHSISTTVLDGTYSVIRDSPEADHIALKRPAPNVVVMALQQNGVLVSTRIYAVLPDGRNMVETVVYPGDDSRLMRTNYFTRVR